MMFFIKGSNEETVKPTIVHDQALVNSIDRLTGVISKHLSDRYIKEASMIVNGLGKLTQSVNDMRVQQDAAFTRLIHLQEENLKLMGGLLQQQFHPSSLKTPRVQPSSPKKQRLKLSSPKIPSEEHAPSVL